MYNHIALGNTAEERKVNLGHLTRSGVITISGYKNDRIYGLLSCTSGKRMKPENRVFFKDIREAVDKGFRPCAHCMPEEYKLWKEAKQANRRQLRKSVWREKVYLLGGL